MTIIPRRTALYALGYGLLIWFEATLMIRWLGAWIFLPQSAVFTLSLFLLTPLVVFAVGWCFFYMFKTPREERAAAAIIICASGLMANAAVIGWSEIVFPEFTAAQQHLYSSWIVWAYGAGLMSGLWPRHLPWIPAR